MKKRKNIGVKILALLALVGIIVSIIGTAILVIMSKGDNYTTPEITADQLQDIINTDNVEVKVEGDSETASGVTQ